MARGLTRIVFLVINLNMSQKVELSFYFLAFQESEQVHSLQKMPFLNCVTVTQNMCIDGFLHPILRQNILARDDV